MNTVSLDSTYRDVHNPADFDPPVAVHDNHLLVKTYPSLTGVFSAGAGVLPSINAKSFRLTNAGSSNVSVSQKVVFASKYFDTTNLGVTPDSPSIKITQKETDTPLGNSDVLQLKFTNDTAAYSAIPQPTSVTASYSVYFRVLDATAELQPIGLYTERSSIDINHPCASIRIKPNLEIAVRVGLNEMSLDTTPSVELNKWYRGTISRNGTDFTVQVEEYSAGSYTPLFPNANPQTFTSIGNGLLDEMIAQGSFVVAFASEGAGEMQVEAFEAFNASGYQEELIATTTKEYFCHNNLDEFTVSGAVSGYYCA